MVSQPLEALVGSGEERLQSSQTISLFLEASQAADPPVQHPPMTLDLVGAVPVVQSFFKLRMQRTSELLLLPLREGLEERIPLTVVAVAPVELVVSLSNTPDLFPDPLTRPSDTPIMSGFSLTAFTTPPRSRLPTQRLWTIFAGKGIFPPIPRWSSKPAPGPSTTPNFRRTGIRSASGI